MDTLTTYQRIVRDELQPYTEIEYADVDAHNKLVCPTFPNGPAGECQP